MLCDILLLLLLIISKVSLITNLSQLKVLKPKNVIHFLVFVVHIKVGVYLYFERQWKMIEVKKKDGFVMYNL
jgi:hypothetical protein